LPCFVNTLGGCCGQRLGILVPHGGAGHWAPCYSVAWDISCHDMFKVPWGANGHRIGGYRKRGSVAVYTRSTCGRLMVSWVGAEVFEPYNCRYGLPHVSRTGSRIAKVC